MKFSKPLSLRIFSLLIAVPCLALAAESGDAQNPHQHHHSMNHSAMDQDRPQPLADESIYNLGTTWKDQSGKKVAISSFKGTPVIMTMLYTSCKAACPLTVADLKKIEKNLPAAMKDRVRFVIASFDSKRDTPEVLAAFARGHGLDLKHWTLLNGDVSSVRELAATLGIRYKQESNLDYSHSNVITVLDDQGKIIHQQVGLGKDPSETLNALKSLPR